MRRKSASLSDFAGDTLLDVERKKTKQEVGNENVPSQCCGVNGRSESRAKGNRCEAKRRGRRCGVRCSGFHCFLIISAIFVVVVAPILIGGHFLIQAAMGKEVEDDDANEWEEKLAVDLSEWNSSDVEPSDVVNGV